MLPPWSNGSIGSAEMKRGLQSLTSRRNSTRFGNRHLPLTHIYPTKTRRHRTPLSGPDTFFASQCRADCVISMAGFDLRQAQVLKDANCVFVSIRSFERPTIRQNNVCLLALIHRLVKPFL